MMRVIDATDRSALRRLATRDGADRARVRRAAARIVDDVRRRGDRAVVDWMRRLDNPVATAPFEVPRREWTRAAASVPREVRDALGVALRHLRRVTRATRPRPLTVRPRPGVRIEHRVRPLACVACYVPGGRYPLPSTLLMTVVPAVEAGVPDVIVACPRPEPVVLYAALEAGASRVLRLGGAQAIAALAYGTRSVPRVDKIVGPGNRWVAEAKVLVSGDVAIDMRAGPSEIVVCASTGRSAWIAADLIAQAEHDPDARALLVTPNRRLAERVAEAIRAQLPPHGPARAALQRHGALIVTESRTDAIALVNALAPEHVVCDRREDVDRFTTAGTVFVGPWSAQAAGDYTTGSNHVLPTGGAARARGGLSVSDFLRVSTVQTLTRRGLSAIGPAAATLAEAEGLAFHARSIRIRL